MAENLMAGTLGNGSILTAGEIHTFLDEANNLIKPKNKQAQDLIQKRIDELKDLIKDYKTREEVVYRKFGVDTIEELQEKLDIINQELTGFQNKVLRTMPLVKDMQLDSRRMEEVAAAAQKKVDELEIKARAEGKTFAQAQEIIAKEFVKHIENQRKKYGIKSKVQGSHVSAGIKKGRDDKNKRKTKIKFDKDVMKGYKKELVAWLYGDDKPNGAAFTIEGEIDPLAIDYYGKLTYYPYYKLTAEEKATAKDVTGAGAAIWQDFKNQISRLAGKYSDVALNVMNSGLVSVEDFFVDSDSEVIGVLGEIQVLILFTALSGASPNSGFLSFLATATQNSKKIGIDILLGKEGIQVKNYNTYGVAGVNEGINLREQVNLSTFLGKLEADLGPDQIQTLADFYTIRAYHIKATKDYEPTLARLQIFDTRIKDYFQAYVNRFLPLETVDKVTRLGKEIELNGVSNLFYYIGGRRLVPVSKILKSYVTYMEKLMAGLINKERRTLTVSPVFNNQETYKNYWSTKDKQSYVNNFSYDAIYDSISINYTINLNIDYVLQEILTKNDK